MVAAMRAGEVAAPLDRGHASGGGSMRKSLLLITVVAVAVSAWRWRHVDEPAADANRLIADRIWLDHIPRGDKDTVEAFFANSKDALGLFAASSQWRGRYELFRYEASGGELRVVYPQTGERERVRVRARRCTDHGMDFCLDIEGASRGVKKYYSRKGWEVDHARDAGAVQAQVEALRAQLGAAE
jgi:hypothetical protein